MRKWMVILLAAMLLCSGAQADEWLSEIGRQAREHISVKELTQAALADYPGWQFVGDEEYWSGSWQEQMGHHCELTLMRITEGQLLVRNLYVLMNPLKDGDAVPWEATDSAPVPLTAKAEARLMEMNPDEIFDQYTHWQMQARAIDGCAAFLLKEGEKLTDLLVYPDFLVAVAQDAQGREGLRIAHWDGEAYVKITSTAMGGWISINEIHTYNDYMELYTDKMEIHAFCDDEGIWRIGGVLGWEDEAYHAGTDGYLKEWDSFITQTNDAYFYGIPTFPVMLDGARLDELPADLETAVARLDCSGFACVKRNGAALYDVPEGDVLASCYARLAGRVLAEKEGWVQVQIGSEEKGMTAWFRTEDMAFDSAVNEVVCGFPSYDDSAWWDMEDMSSILPEHGAEIDPWGVELWLIARLPDGNWLAQVNGELVCEVNAEVIGKTGEPMHEWEK